MPKSPTVRSLFFPSLSFSLLLVAHASRGPLLIIITNHYRQPCAFNKPSFIHLLHFTIASVLLEQYRGRRVSAIASWPDLVYSPILPHNMLLSIHAWINIACEMITTLQVTWMWTPFLFLSLSLNNEAGHFWFSTNRKLKEEMVQWHNFITTN